MKRVFNDREVAFIIEHYAALGAHGCAEKLGKTRQQVTSKMTNLRQTGKTDIYVNSQTLHAALSNGQDTRRMGTPPKVPTDQFINITTPEAAYMLGFLWADGCVSIGLRGRSNKIIFNIVKEDFDSIEQIVDKTGKWHKYIVPKKDARTQRCAVTTNRELAEYLDAMNYRSKSRAPIILDTIPAHLKHYWFRGLMDGDGCFYIAKGANQASICGPRDQDWGYVETLLRDLNAKYTVRFTGKLESGQRSVVTISNLDSITKLGEYLYQGYDQDGIGFHRKREKYLQIKHRFDHSAWHHSDRAKKRLGQV